MSRVTYSMFALLLVLGAVVGMKVSSAEFTDGSVTRTQIGAARDWTPPVVSVDNPANSGNVVNGTVSITVDATDDVTSVDTVVIQLAAEGSSSWSTLCTDYVAPWSCGWDSSTVVDGDYRLRATATDVDGNSATSAEVTFEVINTMRVVLEKIPSPTRGTVTFTARFYNSGGWPVSMQIQALVPGSGWADIPGCGPAQGTVRTCSYDSSAVPGGTFDVRVVATIFWWSFTDTQEGVVVDNQAPYLSQGLTGSSYLSGAISWYANANDNLTGVESVAFEYRRDGGAWETCATDTSAPYSCNFDASTWPDGRYDFRAVATDRAGNAATSTTITRVVDSVGPVVALTLPAGPLSSPVTMTATATDEGAGMAGAPGVQFQYRLQGASGWNGCGNDGSAPYACTTGVLTDGTYEFRAIATNANNRATTSEVVTRVVDTVISSVAISAPGAGTTIHGSTTVTATATSNKGVDSVTLQYRTGSGSWTNVCPADTVAPYSCTWDASTLPYGTYQLQAVMAHGSGLTQTSAAVDVVVPQPRGHDVQGTSSPNGTAGTGDTITLTYTDTMDLSTIAPGLTAAAPVDTTISMVGGSPDRLTFASDVNLGTVYFSGQDYVDYGYSVTYEATISAGTTTVDGRPVTRITVTFGSLTGPGGRLNRTTSTGDLVWTPSATATDTAGNSAEASATTESSGWFADRDL